MGRQVRRDETAGRTQMGRGDAQALVLHQPAAHDGRPSARHGGGRPRAGFVTQLMVGADASLQVARSERTRIAAAHYARMAESLARTRIA